MFSNMFYLKDNTSLSCQAMGLPAEYFQKDFRFVRQHNGLIMAAKFSVLYCLSIFKGKKKSNMNRTRIN